MPDAWSHVATESLRAFLCDTEATGAGFYYRASDEDVEAGRLLVSYLMAHEYSHICLRHRARRNDDSPVALSSVRLRDLTEIMEALSAQQRLQVPVSTDRLRYFFGYQQDELEADLLAFMVIYSRLKDHERSDTMLPLFFRQVGYSLLWGEVSEVIGRTCKNGVSWLEEPLHNPDLCLLGDLAWRQRYPSAYSRLAYLHDRAKIGLDAEHLEIFEKEVHELSMLGTLWRHILDTTSELLRDAARDDHPWSQAFRNSFVWKGMPQSVFGCVGYNDPTDAFRVYRWQDHLQA